MCQVNSFNVDHEKCIQGCNCCKSKDSAAAISATLAERERIINFLENTAKELFEVGDSLSSYVTSELIERIKGESNE